MSSTNYELSEGWTVRWSSSSLTGAASYIALFSGPFLRANMVYTYDDLVEKINERKPSRYAAVRSSIPKSILEEALAILHKDQAAAA